MFRIGEFSKLTQVSIRMLRYYDEASLLKPAETHPWTGYRLYSADQIPVLNKIIYLRDSGFTVAEIAQALSSQNDSFTLQLLQNKHMEIEEHIQAEKVKLQKIQRAKQELQGVKDEMFYQITIKSIPSIRVLSLRKVIPDYYAEGDLWKEMSEFVRQHTIEISPDTFSIYHDNEYKEKNVDVELCAPVKKSGQSSGAFTFRCTEAVPLMACTMVYGDFSNIAEAYIAFAKWLQDNSQYTMGATSRQIVHRGPWNEEDPGKYLTEIQIPLDEHPCRNSFENPLL
ncbi:MAG: effector binding domain-containing protein [Eubacteriales bacterium]|nr:effector binding domain-containing protein [Eubacteriales bacterium]